MMKKAVSAALACVLLALCFLLSSCGEPSVVGKWEMKLDGEKALLMFGAGIGSADVSGSITAYVTFAADGTFTTVPDGESIKEFYRQNVRAIVESSLRSNGTDFTFDEYLERLGLSSEDELIDLMIDDLKFSESVGRYSLDGDVLVTDTAKMKIDLGRQTLEIKEIVDGDGENAQIVNSAILPLTLKRGD